MKSHKFEKDIIYLVETEHGPFIGYVADDGRRFKGFLKNGLNYSFDLNKPDELKLVSVCQTEEVVTMFKRHEPEEGNIHELMSGMFPFKFGETYRLENYGVTFTCKLVKRISPLNDYVLSGEDNHGQSGHLHIHHALSWDKL